MKKNNTISTEQLEPLLQAWGRWAGENMLRHLQYRRSSLYALDEKNQSSSRFEWYNGFQFTEEDIATIETVICRLRADQPTLAKIVLQEYTQNPKYSSQRSRAAKANLSVTEYRRRLLQAQQWLRGYFVGCGDM